MEYQPWDHRARIPNGSEVYAETRNSKEEKEEGLES